MKNRRLFVSMTICALLGLWAWAAASTDSAPVGTVEDVAGQVEAQVQGQASRTLGKGARVYVKDVVVTKTDKDKARIKFLDDSVLEVGPASAVSLEDFAYDEADAAKSRQNLKLGKGVFRYVTGKVVAQNPENLRMESPLSVIGIRGTTTDHWIQTKEKNQNGRTVLEVEAELHALRETKTGTQVVVQTDTERLTLTKPDEVAWVRPKLPGMVRPLNDDEKQNFSKTPFTRQPFDPAPRRGLTGGSG